MATSSEPPGLPDYEIRDHGRSGPQVSRRHADLGVQKWSAGNWNSFPRSDADPVARHFRARTGALSPLRPLRP